MLRCLRGTVLFVESEMAVLEAGGLGFEVLCSRRALDLCRIDEEVRLFVVLQIQEGGASLFGFADTLKRDLFRRLTGVRGVGGKMALALLRQFAPSAIISAIASDDLAALTQVPGIGKRTAERLCFEMKRHLEDFTGLGEEGAVSAGPEILDHFVLEALQSLGFGRSEASRALAAVLKRQEGSAGDLAESALLQETLRELNKAQGR
jgi:Holliday junction DNA helicase RuvA